MRLLIQRVSSASVAVAGRSSGSIQRGLLVLMAAGPDDDRLVVERILQKVIKLRIFADQDGKMNLSVKDVQGGLLLVSQFTLFADTRKGNRPSFTAAAPPQLAESLYDYALEYLQSQAGVPVASGQFGADMQVKLVNDGPVTIWMDSDG
ncbi:MAG: D-tyrosyl-tRNA(Tyr) deacylase [Leptospiraceae bacterium]|nr:D-tyrosyl-tRNA(Tyr) deacylase [Leptospiraceae bacterium]